MNVRTIRHCTSRSGSQTGPKTHVTDEVERKGKSVLRLPP